MDTPTETDWYWAGEPTTPDDEYARTRAAAAIYDRDELRNEMKRRKRRQKRRVTMKFEEAIRGLPETAPEEEILNWIGGHPAMTRHVWLEEGDEPIVIAAEDVMEPPNRSAPCRLAVSLLQYFVNRPEQFYDKLLDRQLSSQPEYSVDH